MHNYHTHCLSLLLLIFGLIDAVGHAINVNACFKNVTFFNAEHFTKFQVTC